ncbi:uncharacterized protein BCR38DRAFT_480123 [Pseudomassariella vexata]|uniref:Uncharacterized protein n=1 Tax=Pseudomassariella vexata TaxID=1141098 RepID=A0A1Y2EJ73_9PEZI|nr:uncharacterized protein BCR38DRAFT_480123 [Pseudomassariella vexata]ORY71623.1 hypothetical protein BCR38DRAFT_480123 [Pseudomassariella vexata]
MADRPPPVTRPGAPRPARNNHTAATGVRRNLFQSQLTRRPTPASSNSAETMRFDIDVLSEADTSEIVIRDQNGEVQVGDPPAPSDDEAEVEALDDAQENERERRKLAEAVKHHQINHNRAPAELEEVLETLRASMRAQVAALAEDNWMYEPEEQPRGQ